MVRCLNVFYYFTADEQDRMLDWFGSVLTDGGILILGGDWAFTTECRLFTHQKIDGELRPRELAFSLDNVVPFGLVPFFAIHDGDRELAMLARLVRTLRRDDAFRERYYEVAGGLRADYGVCARDADGYYGSVPADLPPADLWGRVSEISDALDATLGAEAVSVLERAGWAARVNEVGLVSVSLESTPGTTAA